jgi:tetratricopeptide (TPR) repeat protein
MKNNPKEFDAHFRHSSYYSWQIQNAAHSYYENWDLTLLEKAFEQDRTQYLIGAEWAYQNCDLPGVEGLFLDIVIGGSKVTSYLWLDVKQRLRWLQKALYLSQKSGNAKKEWECLQRIGSIYHETGELDSALNYRQQALNLAQDNFQKSASLQSLGNTLISLQRQIDAEKLFRDALKFAETGAIKCSILTDLANCLQSTEPRASLELLEQALQTNKEACDKHQEAIILELIGTIYKDSMSQSEKALEYYQLAWAHYVELNDWFYAAMLLLNICTLEPPERSLKGARFSLSIFENVKDYRMQIVALRTIGWNLVTLHQYSNAIKVFQNVASLARKLNDKEQVQNAHEVIQELIAFSAHQIS